MNPARTTKLHLIPATAAMAVGLLTTAFPGRAAIEVPNDAAHVISGTVTGTLVAIDVPTLDTSITYNSTTPGGPSWTTGGGIIAHQADQGFKLQSRPGDTYGSSPWEPDGTPVGEAFNYGAYSGSDPEVQYIFNLAASGIDLPDGSIINGVYTTWQKRNDTADYRYTEGTASDTTTFSFGSLPADDLVMRWYDSDTNPHDANFQRLFAGPITVEGGDGFTLLQYRQANTAHIDAVILDVTIPSTGTPPTIEDYDPAIGATNVSLTTDLVATFSESLVLTGNGSVTVKNLDDGSGNSDIDITVTDPLQLSVNGTILTINPPTDLDTSTNYSVRISADAIEDSVGDAFAGILDDTWNFSTTSDATPPTLVPPTDPADDATDVPPYSDLVATFSEDIVLVAGGTVTIKNLDDGSGASDLVISLPDGQVSVSGTDLTINPSAPLDAATNYAVRISGDAIVDINGNAFAGINDDTTWNFTTTPPPSGGIEVTPDHIVSGSVAGTLVAIDVPYQGTSFPIAGPLGPDWPENADDGWEMLAGSNLEANHGTSPWEPDATPLAEAKTLRLNSAPGSSYTFDLPDGTVINAIYATWLTRSTSGANWSYTEGADSDSNSRTMTSAPSDDLVLSWTDSDTNTHEGNFELLFSGPITVEGGDGFTLKAVRTGNTHQADAVVLDILGKATILSFKGAGATGVINQTAKTIALEVPFGTDLATLAPTFTLSSGTCDQTSGAAPTPTFADQNPATYTVTDTSTDPDTVNDYTVTVTVGPQVGTLVIDLGTSPTGTFIEGGTTIGTGPTNLPLPSLPAGSILRSIAINALLESSDNDNFASDLSVLLDPTPGAPGGDFSLEITNGTNPFGATLELDWPTAANNGPGTALADTKTDADFGVIDLAGTGLFLGNSYVPGNFVAGQGGIWSGTITLTYDIPSGGSDYTTWAAGFLPADVSDPNGDFDGDGLTNDQERAFGLDPTLAGSVDPFIVPIDATGAFSYTRRDPALSGLTYTIWTSPDLEAWTEDTGAVQTPGAVVDEVQPVAVTTSATAVDGKLFVQVRAN